MAKGITDESKQIVGANESIAFSLDVSDVGTTSGSVSSPTMRVTLLSAGTDVTATVAGGSMSVSGQIITLKHLGTPSALTEGEDYRVDVGYAKDGNTLETEFPVFCPARTGVG